MTIATRQTLNQINATRLNLFTENEACEILGISPVTLWRLRKAGAIAYRSVCGSPRYSEEDLAEYLERAKCEARAA